MTYMSVYMTSVGGGGVLYASRHVVRGEGIKTESAFRESTK